MDSFAFHLRTPTSPLFVFTSSSLITAWLAVVLPFGGARIEVAQRHRVLTRLHPTAEKVSCALSCCLIACPPGYERQRTAMCPDGERARELIRNSQPSYGAGLEVGALGMLVPGGFLAAGTSRSPFRAIPVERSPPDPVVAIDISRPKMMMENRAAQHAPKIRIIMAYFPHTLIN